MTGGGQRGRGVVGALFGAVAGMWVLQGLTAAGAAEASFEPWIGKVGFAFLTFGAGVLVGGWSRVAESPRLIVSAGAAAALACSFLIDDSASPIVSRWIVLVFGVVAATCAGATLPALATRASRDDVGARVWIGAVAGASTAFAVASWIWRAIPEPGLWSACRVASVAAIAFAALHRSDAAAPACASETRRVDVFVILVAALAFGGAIVIVGVSTPLAVTSLQDRSNLIEPTWLGLVAAAGAFAAWPWVSRLDVVRARGVVGVLALVAVAGLAVAAKYANKFVFDRAASTDQWPVFVVDRSIFQVVRIYAVGVVVPLLCSGGIAALMPRLGVRGGVLVSACLVAFGVVSFGAFAWFGPASANRAAWIGAVGLAIVAVLVWPWRRPWPARSARMERPVPPHLKWPTRGEA